MTLRYIFLLVWWAGLARAQSLLPDSLANAPDSLKCWSLRELGDKLIEQGKMAEAKTAYQQALDLAQATNRPVDIGMGYRAMAYWYQNANDYGKAMTLNHRALGVFQQHAPMRAVRVYLRIAQSYLYLKEPDKARSYLQKGLALARQQRDTSDAVHFYGSLSLVEKDLKNYPKSLAYSKIALRLYRQINDSQEYHVALLNQALLYKDMQQHTIAEAKLKQVAAYARQTKNDEMLAYVDINLPNVLVPLNRLDEAEAASQRALAWINRTGVNQLSMNEEVYGHLSRIAERRGNYQQALAYYKRQMAAHDSVFSAAKNQQIAELDSRYKSREQEARIQNLNESNAQKDRQIWAGVGGITLLTVLLGGLFLQYQSIRRKRAKIQRQADQLKTLMRELHHRVKNNLAIVSSLLRLQVRHLDDERAIEAVRVSQQRVQAMALIHQRLYQTDAVSSVNMREFLTDLAQNLMQAYGFDTNQFDLQIAIDQPDIDVDVAIPVGLIANELITNAFKYAYADVERPRLHIGLHSRDGLTLEVHDNGPGVADADWQPQTNRQASFGQRLVATLSQQLDATCELIRQNGTLFRLHVPANRLQAVG